MVQLQTFAVEAWMDKYETTPDVLNVGETCSSSISLNELMQLSTNKDDSSPLQTNTRLTYGDILGSVALREQVAALCSGSGGARLTAENVIVTQGAIGANFLSLYTLVGPGDHVVCVYPTYQQLYSVPESLGAKVSLWRLREENGYVPDLDDLKSLVQPNTKMIIINNPNNPTGAAASTSILKGIVAFAKERDIILMSDEVYRPLFHGTEVAPSAASLGYDRTVVTGSMSKAWSLAGIRLGWVASRDPGIIKAIAGARDYTTISVSQLSDQVASYALSPAVQGPLIQRNISLARHNLGLLKTFVEAHPSICHWVQPVAGTTAFIRFVNKNKPVDDVAFCVDLLEKTKILFCPGSHCFGGDEDFKGYVRVGYVSETSVLEEALVRLSAYVKSNLSP